MEGATDVSYTDGELMFHMDQCFMESAPGIQVFVCLKLVFYDPTK